MNTEFTITQNEKHYLRELARKYLEYANLPVMEERKKLWYAHNALQAERPVVVMEMTTFENDMLPAPACELSAARNIEKTLMRAIINHELIDDDKVISSYYPVYWRIDMQEFGLTIPTDRAEDSFGRVLGYSQHHPITDLKNDFSLLRPSTYNVDRAYTQTWKSFVEDVIGDILPVRIKNASLWWHVAPSKKIIDLMGLKRMMYAMLDYPAELHALYAYLQQDVLAFIRWQEQEELLTLNNGNDYAGAGSYGFTTELPSETYQGNGRVSSKDLWGNLNSQETVGVSPRMFGEFVFPYYQALAKEFGLTYYGCCEPVHAIWEPYISKLAGLRKVSVSPWCDEQYMGDALRDSKIIYSRKPSPNYIGVGGHFDESAFAEHITNTLKAARGCELEIIFRDTYTVSGDLNKPGKAVKIVRELIEKLW